MLSRLSGFSGPLSNLFSSIKGFITNGLILRYELKNSDTYYGTTTVTDLESNSNGTLVNSPGFSSNGYLNFDGTNDYLMTDTSLNSKLSPANTSNIISFFIWIYPQDNGVIVTEQGNTTLNGGWHDAQIEMVSGSLRFGLWNGAGISYVTSSISTPINNWYYVGLTYDGTTLRAYVNSQLAGSTNFTRSTPYSAENGLHYGIAAADFTSMGDGSYAKVKVGDFHVYNKVLSQQEVLNNYNATKSNYIYTNNNVLLYIDANDPQSYSSGTSISDLSGNSNTHDLLGGASFSNLFGVKSFDCSSANYVIDCTSTGPTLPTSGYTYVSWAKINSSNSSYRTLYRSDVYDHALLVDINSNDLGMWDNNGTNFNSANYDISSYNNKWVQWSVVGDSNGSTFYLNGDLVGTTTRSAAGNKHNCIGNTSVNGGQPFGYIGNTILYNTKLTQAQIKQNYDALKHVYESANFVTDNLALYFNPGNLISYPGSGSTINDLSGNSLNGTTSNTTFNKTYFTFNGTSSYISSADNPLIEPGAEDLTVEVWVNHSVITGSSRCILSKTNGGNAADWGYGIRTSSTGSTYMEVGNGTTTVNSPSYTLSTNTWYQIVGVFTNVASNKIELYINGVSQGSNSHSFSSIKNTTRPLSIGSFDSGAGGFGQWVNGKIGITRIYNSALSSADILQNFNSNKEQFGL